MSSFTTAAAASPGSTSTTKTPSPILDHIAYPHLIDTILYFAPHGALLAFRATSKHYLNRVDALLFSHVVVPPPVRTFDYPGGLRSYNGDALPLPGQFWSAAPLVRSKLIKRLKQHTRLIDMYSLFWCPPTLNLVSHYQQHALMNTWKEVVDDACSNVSLVRRMSLIHPTPKVKRCVDFVMFTYTLGRWLDAETWVSTIVYNPLHPKLAQANICPSGPPCTETRHLVYIFKESTDVCPPHSILGVNNTEQTSLGMIGALAGVIAECAVHHDRIETITVVGLHAIDGAVMGRLPGLPDAEFEERFITCVAAAAKVILLGVLVTLLVEEDIIEGLFHVVPGLGIVPIHGTGLMPGDSDDEGGGGEDDALSIEGDEDHSGSGASDGSGSKNGSNSGSSRNESITEHDSDHESDWVSDDEDADGTSSNPNRLAQAAVASFQASYEAVKTKLHSIKFLTHDEYERQIGKEMYELETACPAAMLERVGGECGCGGCERAGEVDSFDEVEDEEEGYLEELD